MTLNTEQAFELYELLNPYIPVTDTSDNLLDFVGTIVGNVNASDNPENFGLAVLLMHDVSIEDLQDMDIHDVISLFTDGLKENKIISLVEFFRWLMM